MGGWWVVGGGLDRQMDRQDIWVAGGLDDWMDRWMNTQVVWVGGWAG